MKYNFVWKLVPVDGGVALSGDSAIELDQDEVGVLPEDLSTDHPMRSTLEACGPVALILQCRERGGERLKVPTLEFITKGSRHRRRNKVSIPQ
ncbi:MAG: hypothetical protein IIA63_12305 [Nitrospinae bacterium]|nr:hypothetical protein [Nitrospinota bacterium]